MFSFVYAYRPGTPTANINMIKKIITGDLLFADDVHSEKHLKSLLLQFFPAYILFIKRQKSAKSVWIELNVIVQD